MKKIKARIKAEKKEEFLKDKNMFMLGGAGTGKSCAAKLEIKRLLSTRQDVNVYVLDAFGKYDPLVTDMQGQLFNVSDEPFSETSYISDNRFVVYNLKDVYGENDASVYISLLTLIQTLTDKPSYVFIENINTLFQSPIIAKEFYSIIKNCEKRNFHYVGISMTLDFPPNCQECEMIEDHFDKVYF